MTYFPAIKIERSTRRKNRVVKTRRFEATLLGRVQADALWDLGQSETIRPIWIAYTATAQATRAFTANLRGGYKAEDSWRRIEMPKSARHRWTTQVVGDAVITTAYLPELFDLDPGPDQDRICFVAMPPTWWVDAQAEALHDFGSRARDVARAAHFVAYLDRRTPMPIVHDLGFHLRIWDAVQDQTWFRGSPMASDQFSWENVTSIGLEAPVAVSATHDEFESFLRELTATHFEEINGKTCINTDRGLLPHPDGPGTVVRINP